MPAKKARLRHSCRARKTLPPGFSSAIFDPFVTGRRPEARIRIEESIRALFPFYAAMLAVTLLATYWPAFSLWLPGAVL